MHVNESITKYHEFNRLTLIDILQENWAETSFHILPTIFPTANILHSYCTYVTLMNQYWRIAN